MGSTKDGANLAVTITPALKQAIVKTDELFKEQGSHGMDCLIMRDMVKNYEDHVMAGRIIEYMSSDGTTKMAAWKTEAQGRREAVMTTKKAKREDFSNDDWFRLCGHLSSDAQAWTKFAMMNDCDLDPVPPTDDILAMQKHTLTRVQEAYDQITRVTSSVRT